MYIAILQSGVTVTIYASPIPKYKRIKCTITVRISAQTRPE